MAHAPEVRAAVRRTYVAERQPLEVAAERHGVSYNTVRQWKRAAKDAGDDWDRARSAARMAAGGLGDLTTQVLEEFALLFQSTMEQIGSSEFDGIQKAEAMSRLADAYTKTVKAAGGGDNRIAKFAIAMQVMETLAKFISENYPADLERFAAILEPFGERLSEVFG
jgi:transposase